MLQFRFSYRIPDTSSAEISTTMFRMRSSGKRVGSGRIERVTCAAWAPPRGLFCCFEA